MNIHYAVHIVSINGLYRTYEELKRCTDFHLNTATHKLYRTYEELKLIHASHFSHYFFF